MAIDEAAGVSRVIAGRSAPVAWRCDSEYCDRVSVRAHAVSRQQRDQRAVVEETRCNAAIAAKQVAGHGVERGEMCQPPGRLADAPEPCAGRMSSDLGRRRRLLLTVDQACPRGEARLTSKPSEQSAIERERQHDLRSADESASSPGRVGEAGAARCAGSGRAEATGTDRQ